MFLLINFFFSLMMILFMIMNLINKLNYSKKNNNLMNNIECGFNNLNNKHLPMYNNFFIIMIIFLIFDLEFFLLIPIILMMKNMNWYKIIYLLTMVIMFIYFTLIYEIKLNNINWIKLDKFMLFAMMYFNKYLIILSNMNLI